MVPIPASEPSRWAVAVGQRSVIPRPAGIDGRRPAPLVERQPDEQPGRVVHADHDFGIGGLTARRSVGQRQLEVVPSRPGTTMGVADQPVVDIGLGERSPSRQR